MAATTVATETFGNVGDMATFINALANKSDDVIAITSQGGYLVLLYKLT